MRENGELGYAQNQLKQADMEEEPRQMAPYDIGEYFTELEEQVWKGKVGKSMDINRSDTNEVASLTLTMFRPFLTPYARALSFFTHRQSTQHHGLCDPLVLL